MTDEKKRKDLVAPCGIDCGICEVHVCGTEGPLFDYLVSLGIPKDRLPCAGCREEEGDCPAIGSRCETYTCVEGHGVEYCFECGEFPCRFLHPAADRADTLPHNLKMFNLCTIMKFGVEGFIPRSAEIKKTYTKGKMRIGKGPRIEEEADSNQKSR